MELRNSFLFAQVSFDSLAKDAASCSIIATHFSVAHCLASYPIKRGIDQYRICPRVRLKVLKTAACAAPARGLCRLLESAYVMIPFWVWPPIVLCQRSPLSLVSNLVYQSCPSFRTSCDRLSVHLVRFVSREETERTRRGPFRRRRHPLCQLDEVLIKGLECWRRSNGFPKSRECAGGDVGWSMRLKPKRRLPSNFYRRGLAFFGAPSEANKLHER